MCWQPSRRFLAPTWEKYCTCQPEQSDAHTTITSRSNVEAASSDPYNAVIVDR